MPKNSDIFSKLVAKDTTPYKVTLTLNDLQVIYDRCPQVIDLLKNSKKVTTQEDKIIVSIVKLHGRSVQEQNSLDVGLSAETQELVFKFGFLYKSLNPDLTFTNKDGDVVKGIEDDTLLDIIDNPDNYEDTLNQELKDLISKIKSGYASAYRMRSIPFVTSMLQLRFDPSWTEEFTKVLPTEIFKEFLEIFNKEFTGEEKKKDTTTQLETSTKDK